MNIGPNTLVAPPGENIFKIYSSVRKYIEDKEALEDFDEEMDELKEHDEPDDAESFFEDMILDYLNEFVAPQGTLFGIHAESSEIGFWDESLVDGMEDTDDSTQELPEEEEEQDREKILEELLRQEDVRRASSDQEGVEERREGQAEVLDTEGEVIATTKFKVNPEPAKVICMICKKVIRGDPDAPDELASHGICDECLAKHYPEPEDRED